MTYVLCCQWAAVPVLLCTKQLLASLAGSLSALCSVFKFSCSSRAESSWPLATTGSLSPLAGQPCAAEPECRWCRNARVRAPLVRGIQVPAQRSALGTTPRGAQNDKVYYDSQQLGIRGSPERDIPCESSRYCTTCQRVQCVRYDQCCLSSSERSSGEPTGIHWQHLSTQA